MAILRISIIPKRNSGAFWRRQLAVSVVAVTAMTFLAAQRLRGTETGERSMATKQEMQYGQNDTFREIVERMVLPNFETSLEMKENADFLLTPAFLVQGAISDQAVLTYPAE